MTVIRVPVSGATRPALVDPWNSWVQRHSWSLNGVGYAVSRFSKRNLVYLHVAIVQPPPGLTVDHEDRDRLNNLESNLRLATKSEQLYNSRLRSDSTSGFKGVSYVPTGRKRWKARIINPEGRAVTRFFATPEEAAECYDAWAIEFRGEFACTNADLMLL
jgi:hypothetical protein